MNRWSWMPNAQLYFLETEMANMIVNFTLELNKDEALALKQILGSMNDKEFAAKGIKGENRELIRDIWDLLPDKDGYLVTI